MASLVPSAIAGSPHGSLLSARADGHLTESNSTVELDALGFSTYSTIETSTIMTPSFQDRGLSLSPGELALLQQVNEPPLTASPLSIDDAAFLSVLCSRSGELPSIREETPQTPQDLSASNSSVSLLPGNATSTPGSHQWHNPFPLRYIGAITEEGEAAQLQPLRLDNSSAEAVAPVLTVFGEYAAATEPGIFLPMRQPSASDQSTTSGLSVLGSISSVAHPLDNHSILALVQRAQHWLLHYRPDNRDPPLSPSIYWAVRSLRTYYATEIQQAERTGAVSMEEIDDDEWPPPTEGGDTYDWSGVPDWLCVLVNMDNIHGWGMRGIRTRNTGLTGINSLARWYLLRDSYVEDIPWRELDDPPDVGVSGDIGGDRSSGIIEELTNTNEDISSKST